jgi:phospholipase/carboxylesterase/glyoxalase family protein
VSAESGPDGFVHRFQPAAADEALAMLLLHGTGGDENDLVPLGRLLKPGAALLSPRGKVLENGMPRFFRRFAEGVFDLEDLARRTVELAEFVHWARERYALAGKPLMAVGFSNGANIAVSLMLTQPRVLAGAVLFRAMVPFVPEHPPPLEGIPVLLSAGRADSMVGLEQPERLADLLRGAGARVALLWDEAGHTLGVESVRLAREWLGTVELTARESG